MRSRFLLITGVTLAAIVIPSVAVATHGKDYVRARDNEEPTPFGAETPSGWRIEARSGPSGENPEGTIRSTAPGTTETFAVTCLAVNGSEAVVGGTGASGGVLAWLSLPSPGAGEALVQRVSAEVVDCSTPQPGPANLAAVVIHDS